MPKVETATQRKRRLEKNKKRYKEKIKNETSNQRELRPSKAREYQRRYIKNQRSKDRERRLIRQRAWNAVNESSFATFTKSINVYAEKVCDVCTKKCYPKQVTNLSVQNRPPNYLPCELIGKGVLTVCHRCKSHLVSKKKDPPPKSYWNNLDPGKIPPELSILSEAEQRLLARINPFLKIIKFSGSYGQYGFKGQAVLFATDIFEVVEKLPTFLPRSTSNTDMIVVTELLENLGKTRNYSVSRENLIAALRWLKENNKLYNDVIINENVHLDEQDLIRVSNEENAVNTNSEETDVESQWIPIGNKSAIIHASWHQGNPVRNELYKRRLKINN